MTDPKTIAELKRLRAVIRTFTLNVAHHADSLEDEATQKRYHELYNMVRDLLNDPNFTKYVQPISHWYVHPRGARLWREHAVTILNSATQLLSYIDALIAESIPNVEKRNNAVQHNETKQHMQRIISIIAQHEGPHHNTFVDDSIIAQETRLTIQDVRDYLDMLEREGKIQSANSHDGYSAILTSLGRITLRDPSYLTPQNSTTVIHLSGNYQGAILNIQSTLNNASQTIGNSPALNQPDKEALQALVAQLNEALQEAPEDKVEEAEAVAEAAKNAIEAATKDRPNKTTVKITADGLKQAAQNIAMALPTVFPIVQEIISRINR